MRSFYRTFAGSWQESVSYSDLTDAERKLVDSENWIDREVAARFGLAFEVLMHDEAPAVRRQVALHADGTTLDKLATDKDFRVREAVAKAGDSRHHALLSNDTSWVVRAAVAESTRDIDTLVALSADQYHWVRAAVAQRGVALDVLFDDPDEGVRAAAQAALTAKGWKTIQQWTYDNPYFCGNPANVNTVQSIVDACDRAFGGPMHTLAIRMFLIAKRPILLESEDRAIVIEPLFIGEDRLLGTLYTDSDGHQHLNNFTSPQDLHREIDEIFAENARFLRYDERAKDYLDRDDRDR